MTLPESVNINVDDWHEQLYAEEMDDEQRENVREFIENGLTDRVNAFVEEAIYKRYQQSKQNGQ